MDLHPVCICSGWRFQIKEGLPPRCEKVERERERLEGGWLVSQRMSYSSEAAKQRPVSCLLARTGLGKGGVSVGECERE